MAGSPSARRCAFSAFSVPTSSASISRLKPTTSAARMAARRRSTRCSAMRPPVQNFLERLYGRQPRASIKSALAGLRPATASAGAFRSLDHVIGGEQQFGGNFDAKRLRRLPVDDQLELGWQFDRQVAGPFALENAADIAAGASIGVDLACAIARQPAGLDIFALNVDGGHGVPESQRRDLPPPPDEKRAAADEQGIDVCLRSE